MASDDEKRERLLQFLDARLFDPILKVPPTRYARESERMRLADVKRTTAKEKHRFHSDLHSAAEVKASFLADLGDCAGRRCNRELAALHLPRYSDFRDEFMRLCDRLGV